MKDELFAELMESAKEGQKILSGEQQPSRTFTFTAPDVRGIRENMQLSQAKFAEVLGISLATLRNWEQGRRTPDGPAQVLLKVAATHPDVLRQLNGIS